MAKSLEGKFGNIFKLLSEHYSQLNVKDKFKCAKCKNILINACVTKCGCRFCRECVDKMLTSGCEKCPGNTENCKSGTLSNIVQDHVINIKISKLLVKCPEKMCRHKCKLIQMEEHMRLCLKKPVQCPCHDLGCNDVDLVEDTINKHLQKESFNHWKMLMGLFGELRNEVAQMRKTDHVNKNEIELLREEGRLKDERIDATRDDFKSLKVETEMLRRQIEIGKNDSDSKIESIKAELLKKLGDLNRKFEGIRVDLDAKLDEMRRGCMRRMEEQTAPRIVEMKNCLDGKIDETRFVWSVDEISMKKWPNTRLSKYFSLKSNSYKIQLEMDNYNSQLKIWLRISPGPDDAKLQWPFQAKVRVKVTNKATPAVCLEATKSCNLPSPPNDLCSHNYDDPFQFQISDLSSKRLLLDDCCIVECFIDLE